MDGANACSGRTDLRSAVTTVLMTCGLLLGAATLARAGQVELASRVAPDQIADTATGNGKPGGPAPSLSADGRYVAFVSGALNLVPGQIGDTANVFLRDRIAGTTVLVSRSTAGPAVAANQGGGGAALSPDGRYVAWISTSTDVVAGQPAAGTPPTSLFLFDRSAGTNRLLVRRVDFITQDPVFSQDGRFLLFLSPAPDLVPGQLDTNGDQDAFLYELASGKVSLISHVNGSPLTAAGARIARVSRDGRYFAFETHVNGTIEILDRISGTVDTAGEGLYPVLSADGRYVAFLSFATDLVPGQVDTNRYLDAFLYDRVTRTTVLVSRALGSAVQTGNRGVFSTVLGISPDGRYVAFYSSANDMVAGQASSFFRNLLIFDRTTSAVKLVGDAFMSGFSSPPDTLAFGGDGRSLLFSSEANDVLPGQINHGAANVFLYNTASGAKTLVSASSSGPLTAGDGDSYNPTMSADGRVVVFPSLAGDLVPGLKDFNESEDLFAYGVQTRAVEALTPRIVPSATAGAFGGSALAGISADGRWILFQSFSSHLVPGQMDLNRGWPDLFLYDSQTRSVLLVSRAAGSTATTGDDTSGGAIVSADGRYVAFNSKAHNLTNDTYEPFSDDVFLFDRLAGTTTLVSRSATTHQPAGGSLQALSADGRYLVFAGGDSVVPGSTESGENLFLYDRVAGSITRITRPSVRSFYASISADGRYVGFISERRDLVPGQTDEPGSSHDNENAFLWDRVTGITTLISHTRSSALQAAGILPNETLTLSADGRYAAFPSSATNLDPSVDGPGDGNIYLYDRDTGTNTLVTVSSAPTHSSQPVISADGRIVAFQSYGKNLVPGESVPESTPQLFLYDRIAKSIVLASRAGTAPNIGREGFVIFSSLSADGRYVAYIGTPSGVHPFDFGEDVFLFDRVAGTTLLASPSRTSPAASAGGSGLAQISADGQNVAFSSTSGDLVAGDFNREADVFLYKTISSPGGPVTLPPCILLDTRRLADRPALRSNVRRVVTARGVCGVPAAASAVTVKVTTLQGSGKGNVRLFAGDAAASSGILRFGKQQTRSAVFTLPLTGNGTLTLLPFVAGNGTVQAIVEVDGYTP
jgi:Tol biopolymer transport system component